MRGLVIPANPDQPLREVDLPADGALDQLQAIVGGNLQALNLPPFITDADHATAYVNEDGKHDPDCEPNMRATDLMVPGIGLLFGDYIAGDMLLIGFTPRGEGQHTNLPAGVERRARLIEREAA